MSEYEHEEVTVVSVAVGCCGRQRGMELPKKALERAKEGALGKINFEAFEMRSIERVSVARI